MSDRQVATNVTHGSRSMQVKLRTRKDRRLHNKQQNTPLRDAYQTDSCLLAAEMKRIGRETTAAVQPQHTCPSCRRAALASTASPHCPR